MSYTPPNWDSVDFELESYVVPDGHNIEFNFISGVTVNIKLSGTFIEKPLMIKKNGTFEQVSTKQVGGWL